MSAALALGAACAWLPSAAALDRPHHRRVRRVYTPGLDGRAGPPIEELTVERTVLKPGSFELTVRNDGPDAVRVRQVQVNDAFVAFSGAEDPIGRLRSATIAIPQPWVEGEAYSVAF